MGDSLDLDQDFLTKFSCMGTQDKDVLISELHSILEISRNDCAFFLEMSNWWVGTPTRNNNLQDYLLHKRNLQAAVGAYCDFCGNNVTLPQMSVVDETPVCTVPPNSNFTKTWKLKNSGMWYVLSSFLRRPLRRRVRPAVICLYIAPSNHIQILCN